TWTMNTFRGCRARLPPTSSDTMLQAIYRFEQALPRAGGLMPSILHVTFQRPSGPQKWTTLRRLAGSAFLRSPIRRHRDLALGGNASRTMVRSPVVWASILGDTP